MAVEFSRFHRADAINCASFQIVNDMAENLHGILNQESVQKQIQSASKSHHVQAAILEKVKALGFTDEKKGLFGDSGPNIRPDYFCRINETGILIEIELGKTLENNNDILDVWKCHVCEHAEYLFLIVPKRWDKNPKRMRGNIYERVEKRLSTFFIPQNYLNIKAVYLFGY
jgi:hypothetical protein